MTRRFINSEEVIRRIFLHLKNGTEGLLDSVSRDIRDAAAKIRKNELPRKCSKEKCQKCYLNYLCLSKKEKLQYEI